VGVVGRLADLAKSVGCTEAPRPGVVKTGLPLAGHETFTGMAADGAPHRLDIHGCNLLSSDCGCLCCSGDSFVVGLVVAQSTPAWQRTAVRYRDASDWCVQRSAAGRSFCFCDPY
jgi:hypothetical protein